MDGVIPVKRVSVSAAVEIFREDVPSIPLRFTSKETVQACKQCQRERTKTHNFNTRPKGRRKQNRANTPIVIHLKDTLKAAMQQRQRNKKVPLRKQDSSESKDEADVETDNSSDRGDIDMRDNQRRKNAKNLSAFINRMEKAHQKEKFVNHKGNLSIDNSVNEKLVAEYVLNNVSTAQNLRKAYRKKSIVECDNIDIICNDLNSVESTTEDTEESEISSTTSSSEIQSDSDMSNSQDSLVAQEYKTEELKRLAEYTMGCPLIRYDCLPSSCPECQWYSSRPQYHPLYSHNNHSTAQSKHHSKTPARKSGHGKKYSKVAQHNHHVPFSKKTACVEVGESISTSESDIDDRHSETSVEVDTSRYNCSSPTYKNDSYTWHKYRNSKQLMDIDFAGKHHHKSQYSDLPDLYWDSVYIDLTDTDVTFSVYYHHDLNESQSCSSNSSNYTSITSGSAIGTEQFYTKPYYTVPYYHQYLYCSVYWPPFYNLPMPFCLQPEISLPKTAMVPPEELENCK